MAVAYTATVVTGNVDFGGGAGTTITVAPPTGLAEGNMWVVATAQDVESNVQPVGLESGWTNIGTYAYGTEWPVGRAQFKVAGSSESSVTLDCSSGNHYVCEYQSFAFSGQHSSPLGDAVDEADDIGGERDETFSPSDLSIDSNGSMAVSIVVFAPWTSPADAVTKPSTMTLIAANNAAYNAIASAYQQVNAGTWAPGDWTLQAASSQNIAHMTGLTFEIKPAAGAAGLPPRFGPQGMLRTLLTR